MTTSNISMYILIVGKDSPVTWLIATGKPSPGIVAEPQRTSNAMPIAIIVHPTICTIAHSSKPSHTKPVVKNIFKSINRPNTQPISNWNSCTISKLRRSITICKVTNIIFWIMVYSPIVSDGANPCSLAIDSENGNEELTPHPRSDLIHSTTPSVIK